jgi:hypothetical protein
MQVLLDTKKEYTKYIQESISISIAQKINTYHDVAVANNLGLKGFQNNLNLIKKWDDNTISEECDFLIKHSKYKNLSKIYDFTIKTYIKLRLIELDIDVSNIENNYEYPSLETFIHKCYTNVSIWAWKNPFLFFKTNLKQIEIQNNYNIIEKNVKKIVKNTLRECVPIDKIINNLKNTNNIIKNINDYQLSNDYFKEDVHINNKKNTNNNFFNSLMNYAKNTIYKNKEDFTNKNLISNTTENNKYETQEYDIDINQVKSREVEKLEAESELEPETEVKSESEPETEVKSESEAESEAESEVKSESEAESEVKSESEAESEVKSESEAESEVKSESETESEVKSETEAESEVETEKKQESEAESEAETEEESEVKSEPKQVSEAKKKEKKNKKKSKIINIEKKKSKFIIDTSSSEENSDIDNNNIKKVIW